MDRNAERDTLYRTTVAEYGAALDRLAVAYEADPEKRRDLRQEIHLQLWRSLERFDGRCSLKTWSFRVAHNVAVTWVVREKRNKANLVSLEDIAALPRDPARPPDIDGPRAIERLLAMIRNLKPLDRQIMLSYLEEMDAASISAITGLSPANVAMKIHRIKNVLARNFHEENQHA